MRLYSGKVPVISEEILRSLISSESIDCENEAEVKLDIESVFKEYVRLEKAVSDESRARLESRGLPYGQLMKVKSQVAREKQIPVGDDTLPYLIDQLLHILFNSPNVAEVFAEDIDLRKMMTTVLKKHMNVEQELDQEVRAKIKNLEEGTAVFENEYAKLLGQIRKTKRLT